MNFELTEERQMLSDTLRRYLSDKYDTATRNAILDSDQGYSDEIWAGLAELGILGALFAEEQGGFGGAGFDIAVVFEQLGRAGVVEPVLDTALLGGGLLAAFGQDVEGIIAGERQLAFAHGEPSSRYDLSRVETRFDGSLQGRKAVVINAEAADTLIVSARESGDVDDPAGISLFLVDQSADGLSMRGYPMMSGGRAAEVTFDGVKAERLGPAGGAFEAIDTVVARAEVALAAEAVGAMETATELTRDYLMTRKQFGRPIGTFQALQHRFADLLIELEQARSAVINAAGHLTAPDRARHIAAARNLIGRAGRLVAEEAIQMHGGIAMTQEYELAHIAKRIIMADHRFGDTDTQLERFIDHGSAA